MGARSEERHDVSESIHYPISTTLKIMISVTGAGVYFPFRRNQNGIRVHITCGVLDHKCGRMALVRPMLAAHDEDMDESQP